MFVPIWILIPVCVLATVGAVDVGFYLLLLAMVAMMLYG